MANPYAARLPDGQYRAVFVKYESGCSYGELRWFAYFRITEPGAYFGTDLVRFYNAPKRSFLPRTHNLFLDYVSVFGRRPPARKLTPALFKGCEVLVATATVKHQSRGRRQELLPEDCWYSKVDRMIRLTAGSPACPAAGPR